MFTRIAVPALVVLVTCFLQPCFGASATPNKPDKGETECDYVKQEAGGAQCSIVVDDAPGVVSVRGYCVIDGKAPGVSTAVLFEVTPDLDPKPVLNPDYPGSSNHSYQIPIRKPGTYFITLSCRQSGAANAVSAQIFYKRALNKI